LSFLPQDGNPLTPRGENGKPNLNEELQTRQWSDRVIRREYREWKIRGGTISKPVQVVVTPRVREEVSRIVDGKTSIQTFIAVGLTVTNSSIVVRIVDQRNRISGYGPLT